MYFSSLTNVFFINGQGSTKKKATHKVLPRSPVYVYAQLDWDKPGDYKLNFYFTPQY